MKLSDAKVRNAKPSEKSYKLGDGQGLFLFVSTTGAKSWRFSYRFSGKQKTL
ncbi:MAG: Arm DNA-binding domain-containing protein, partial [bacterium]